MDKYSKKYGFDGDREDVRSFHKQRVMFAIKDDVLHLASRESTDSHADWFERLGWISPSNETLMEKITRGYVDSSGIYAYTGFDFRIENFVEEDLLKHLSELCRKLDIPLDSQIYLGLFRPKDVNSRWKPIKYIGTVSTKK
jgi:hypothetical protein